jgi:penicillin-binding protein 1C
MRFGPEGIVVADRSGRTLYTVPGPEGAYQHRLSWAQVPASVEETFVRLEDRRFYAHGGLDFLALARAVYVNIREGRIVSGASTITMQLARLTHPHGGGIAGKVGEVLRALYLEARLSKRQILLLYLNNLPFGYNTLGVGAAARVYFSAGPEELTPAQVLLLAVIPEAPSRYDPFASPQQRRALRQRAVALATDLSISEAQIDRAMETFRRGEPEFRAPHFVRHVLDSGRWAAAEKRKDPELIRIFTTLDLSVYDEVYSSIRQRLAAVESSGGSADRLRNASALVLDNRSGQVLAWVGSQDFFDSENGGQIDGVLRRHSSGSTLKPFLYAAALEGGYGASSLLPDLALTFGAREGYRPENFDRRSRGLVRLRTALASSLNVPAVYLLSRIGLDRFLDLLTDLGFGLPRDAAARAGLGAAVGNLEVSLLELVRAYGVFPTRGVLPDIQSILEIETADGLHVPRPQQRTGTNAGGTRVLPVQIAWLVFDILADPAARVAGFGTASRFDTAFPAMFKSGTASEYTSLWCLGATSDYTVGVWAGNFDGRSAFGSTGSSLPAAVAVEVLGSLSADTGDRRAPSYPDPPPGLTELRICSQTGYPAAASCPSTREEYYRSGSVPQVSCPVHGRGGTMEELLVRTVLGEQRGVRILFPRNGMIFYREGLSALQDQSIPGWIVAEPEDRITLRLNGRPLPGDDPTRPLLPVQRGRYRLVAEGRFGVDAVTYTVR